MSCNVLSIRSRVVPSFSISSDLILYFSFCSSTPCGIVVDHMAFRNEVVNTYDMLVAAMGSIEDLEQVKRNPLLRARASLHYAIHHSDCLESDALVSARLSLCYVDLAFGYSQSVLESAKEILEKINITVVNSTAEPECVRRLRQRQHATALMYAAEASCALGDVKGALRFLSGDDVDDSIDTLVSNLSGVTLEMATSSVAASRRFAKARAMVRSSVRALTSVAGDTSASRDMDQSVNALDDRSASAQVRSVAQRSLIYTLLRENSQPSAFSMLLS